MVMSGILNKGYLWDNVRVVNGAYGCYLVSLLNKVIYLVSYRDPNI